MSTQQTIFNIADIFKTVLGYLPAKVPDLPASQTPPNPFKVNATNVQRPTTIKGSPLYGLSDTLGREVFCPVSILAGGSRYDFPYTVVGLRSRKIIKETPMVERGGSVIEQISTGPWEVSVKGFLIDPNNDFPDSQLDALNQLYKNGAPVSLVCALTDIFLEVDDKVVMLDLEIPPKPKVIGVRDFSFTLIQDAILDLIKVE